MPASGTNQRRVSISPAGLPAAGSAVEDEGALQGVVSRQLDIVAELGVVRAVAGRLADEYRRAGNGREDRVAQCRRRTVRALVGLEHGLAHLTDRQRAPPLIHIEPDWGALDRDHLADQLGEIGNRAAEFAAVNIEQRLLLRIGGSLVER